MWIHIPGWQIEDLRRVGSIIVTGWQGWLSRQMWRVGQRWRRLYSELSASVGWRCTCLFGSPACLQIVCSEIWARKASVHVVLMKHGWVSFYCSHHRFMPRKLNTPLLLFLDFGGRFLAQILHFLYWGTRKSALVHFWHVQGQAHVGLFQLYPTSLLCHSIRHGENLQQISCCINNEGWLLPWPYILS